MKERISLCGDDCLACPRYRAQSEAELRRVAELWHKVGWRDRVVPAEEMRCGGCGSREVCTYGLLACTEAHGVARCAQCSQFPCERIQQMLAQSRQSQARCRARCTQEEYDALAQAFFHKEENLTR